MPEKKTPKTKTPKVKLDLQLDPATPPTLANVLRAQRQARDAARAAASPAYAQKLAAKKEKAAAHAARPARREQLRMSYKENKELEELPARIEALEAEQNALMLRMSEPDYFKRDIAEQQSDTKRSQELPSLIEEAYARWEELSEKAQRCAK